MFGAFYIAEIARGSGKEKINSRVLRIFSVRSLKPTKMKGWIGEEKEDEVARYAVPSVVRRSLEVTWWLPRWILQAARGELKSRFDEMVAE